MNELSELSNSHIFLMSIGATYSCASDELLHSECLLRSDVTGSTSIFMFAFYPCLYWQKAWMVNRLYGQETSTKNYYNS